MDEELAAQELAALKHDIRRHVSICAEQAARIEELEAALRAAHHALQYIEDRHPSLSGYGVRQALIGRLADLVK